MEIETESNSCRTLAVLGAGGFVGTRLVQLAALGRFRAIPVLRSYRGMARLGPAASGARVIDTKDLEALSHSFEGAHTVVNVTMGDQLRILEDVQLIYAACLKAGVRRLIHTSSAVVFGRAADPAIHDDSPPDTHSWMLYGRGKANAEVWLRSQCANSPLQVVVLRPGLIWGPGSSWSEMVGDQLVHGSAVLSNAGSGIANLVFVDNLVRIILAISSRNEAPSGFYNVNDNELITWADYYKGLALRLGYDAQSVCLCPDNRFRIRPQHLVEWALEQPLLYRSAKWVLKRVSPGTKANLKALLKGSPKPPYLNSAPQKPPVLSRANWLLQNTARRLPTDKLHRDFGPLELIPFEQALKVTAAWLRFAGFAPVAQGASAPVAGVESPACSRATKEINS